MKFPKRIKFSKKMKSYILMLFLKINLMKKVKFILSNATWKNSRKYTVNLIQYPKNL